MHKHTLAVLISLIVLLTACKSTQTRTATTEDIASAKIINSHYNTHIDFNTMAARLKVRYKDDNTSQNVTISLRVEKDKTIWMSASLLGISLAKAKITRDQVQYYEKLDKTYFDGDFKLLSDLLGTSLNYDQVQALLLGAPIFDLQNGRYNAVAGDSNYLIVPKKQQSVFDLFFYLNPGDFTLQQQRLNQQEENRVLTVSYGDYQNLKQGYLPETIKIKAQENDKQTEIDIEYRSIDLDEGVSFPFSIPDGYKEIKL